MGFHVAVDDNTLEIFGYLLFFGDLLTINGVKNKSIERVQMNYTTD